MRKIIALFCLLACPAFAATIPPGAPVFIEPMGGFEISLSAAILKKHVPVTVVDTKEKADYILSGNSEIEKAGWAKTIFVSPFPAAHAAVALKSKDGTLIWAYSVDMFRARKGEQSTAEEIAKHLKKEAVTDAKK